MANHVIIQLASLIICIFCYTLIVLIHCFSVFITFLQCLSNLIPSLLQSEHRVAIAVCWSRNQNASLA